MEREKIYYPWLPNIHRYEQTFMGISMMTFMAGGMAALLLFAIISQSMGSVMGMVVGAVAAGIGFGCTIIGTTKLGVFHDMILPVYLSKRWQSRHDPPIQLPLIISGANLEPVVVEDWAGAQEGVIE